MFDLSSYNTGLTTRSLTLLLCSLSLTFGCADIEGDGAQGDGVSKSGFEHEYNTGQSCGEGCEWSSLAVSLEQLPAEGDCQGTACACVMSSNIWSLCPEPPQSTSTDRSSSSNESWFTDTSSSETDSAPVHHTQNQAQQSSPQATSGQSCAAGCIWSTMAVSAGAQSQEAQCENGGCACVVIGDIWSSCGGTQPQPETQPETQPQPQPQPEQQPQPQQGSYNADVGNRIADRAYQIAVSRNTVGYCYSAVADAIESVTGPFLWGMSAYMAADQLAANSWFTEVSVGDLRALPAGAVVVWGRGTTEHGHISIALGNGREASDHIADQMTYHYGGAPARVFYPR